MAIEPEEMVEICTLGAMQPGREIGQIGLRDTAHAVSGLDLDIESFDGRGFAFSKEKLSYLDLQTFDRRSARCEIGTVDLGKVVGTTHVDYCDHTWGQLKPAGRKYEHLKRANGNLIDLKANPQYYLDTAAKRAWSFYTVGDRVFIAEGNHRTVIARYFLALNNFPPVVHGVQITHL